MATYSKMTKQQLLDIMYEDLQNLLSVESDSEVMELIYQIVALEIVINSKKDYEDCWCDKEGLVMPHNKKDHEVNTCWDCKHGEYLNGKCQKHDESVCAGCGEPLLDNQCIADDRHATCV